MPCWTRRRVDQRVVVVVFFTLIDRASTIPVHSNIRGCQSGTCGLLDIKRSEEHLQSSNESKVPNFIIIISAHKSDLTKQLLWLKPLSSLG